MSNLNKHIKTDKIKWFAVAVGFLLLAMAIVGMFLQIFGTGKQKPSEWFNKPDTEQGTSADEENDGGELTITPENTSTMTLSVKPRMAANDGIAMQSSSGYTLTATIEPSNVTNNKVDWEIYWVDGAPLSSQPVTDYVTCTPTGDGALTATVTCLKSFRGSGIYIKVVSREVPSVFALCNVTYTGIPTAINANNFSFSITNRNGVGAVPFTLTNAFSDVADEFYSYDNITYSYTVSGTVIVGKVEFNPYTGQIAVSDEHAIAATKDMLYVQYKPTEKEFAVCLQYDDSGSGKSGYILSGSSHNVTVSFTINCNGVSKTVTGSYYAAVNSVSLSQTTLTF